MKPEVAIGEDEELHELFDGRLRIIQKKEGYRFSLDAILLAHFTSQLSAGSIIDLGTGSGIIPLILARKMSASSIVGVEVQEDMADMAKRTMLLNGLDDRVSILHGDLREVSDHFTPASFDLVVSNPPYYVVKDGRINPNQQKAIARHEIMGALGDTIRISDFLVKPSGLVVIIFPARRIVDLLSALRESGIEPKLLQTIYIHKQDEGKFVIVKGCKGGDPELEIKEPFFVYDDGKNYSKEMQRIYDEI
jgi:tRNA1Val (adenine37-N6)-methyltransferase